MSRRRKRDEEPLSGEEVAASDAMTGMLAEVRGDRVAPQESEPPTGEHGCDPLRAMAVLWRIPELAAVTWHHSPSTRDLIDGSLTIPADPELRPMSPEAARHELERFGSWLAGGPATISTAAEGKRTRVIVGGLLHGVQVTLSALMPPADPLMETAPPTVGFVSVPELAPVAVAGPTHPYIGPLYETPAARMARRGTPTTVDETTGDAA